MDITNIIIPILILITIPIIVWNKPECFTERLGLVLGIELRLGLGLVLKPYTLTWD